MKITILYDNTALKRGLKADWGFSCLLEIKNKPKILFDTGADGKILLSNMKKLKIDPMSINEIFISHAHFDHTGGLSEFLNINRKVKVFIPPSFHGFKKKNVIVIKKPTEIHKDIFSSGEIDNIEQVMVIKSKKGITLIVGCSHPYMGKILDTVKRFGNIYAIIGGMHGFSDIELLENLEVICPTHCTQYKSEIKEKYPQKFIEGGVGQVIKI